MLGGLQSKEGTPGCLKKLWLASSDVSVPNLADPLTQNSDKYFLGVGAASDPPPPGRAGQSWPPPRGFLRWL